MLLSDTLRYRLHAGVDNIRTNLVPNSRVKSIHWFLRNTEFENTSLATIENEFDTYTIYIRDPTKLTPPLPFEAFSLKNVSFFTTLTKGGVTTFSRVNFSEEPITTGNDEATTEKVGEVFSTEYNIVPWIVNPGSDKAIITVKVPANSFIEKFTFEFYTEESSTNDTGTNKRYTNIPGFDIKRK